MTDLATFLAWFSGYAENIKQRPTVAQWKRIREEIAKIDPGSIPAPSRAASSAAAAPAEPPKRKPKTKSEWIKQYTDALERDGMDPDSAREMAQGIEVNLHADPVASARTDLGLVTNS